MIFSTFETNTDAFIWNTGERVRLEKGAKLSDYTELQEEFDEKTLYETYEWVRSRNKGLDMTSPSLMMVITGINKSCRVWADKALLKERLEIEDPKEGFEYYSEQ